MKTNFKKALSLVLALLMLLPLFTAFVTAAEYVDITDTPKNVAGAADITVTDGLTWNGWKPEYLVDGDHTTGTYSPRGRSYAITLTFAEPYYFSDFIVAINREGTLPDVPVPEKYSDTTEKIKITAYNGSELVYESAVIDTTGLEEVSANIWTEADRIVVSAPSVSDSPLACEALWEIEAYARTTPGTCDAEVKNVASEALISTVDKKTNDEGETIYTDASWWAMDIDALTDGDIHTGTSSPKRAVYFIQLDYGQERKFSSVKLYTNGYGTVANQGTPGIEKDAEGNIIKQSSHFTSYSITVFAYDYNDDLVYESDLIDVSSLEDVTFNIGVDASIIRIQISGAGNAGYSGVAFMWEVEAYEETGSHAFEKAGTKNPSCVAPGYIEYKCQDPNCDYTKKEVVGATGYHEWANEYEVLEEPTASANGTALYTCKICSATAERDIPALEHNWDNGTTIDPDCVNEGYTLYNCTDNDCDLSYKSDFVEALGHNYDDGVVTKQQTIDQKGLLVYTCIRDDCGEKSEKILRKARYTDNTFKVDNSIVKNYDSKLNYKGNGYDTLEEADFAELGKYIFDGKVDGNYWFAPGNRTTSKDNGVEIEHRESGFLYIYLDREYYFTKGTIYVGATYKWFEVHFEYQNEEGEWVRSATFAHDRIQSGMTGSTINPLAVSLTGALNNGARASRIAIESVNGDANISYVNMPQNSPAAGGRLQFYEIELEAHACDLTEADYEDESKWNDATCTSDGSCKATCSVCKVEQTVVLPSEEYGHEYGSVTPTKNPTCSENGIGKAECTLCRAEKADIVIPKTGNHVFEKVVTYVDPTCNSKGIEHLACIYCDAVGKASPIEATGVHVYDWIVRSSANYTAEGQTIHACKFCGEKSGLEEDIITEKLAIPEEFISFDGFELRMNDFVGLRAKFSYDTEILAELQKTCDVTITVNITDSNGETRSVEVYGKHGTKKYDAENGEFAVVIKAPSCVEEYTFSYSVKLVNFRGTVEADYEIENATSSVYDVAQAALNSGDSIPAAIKTLYEEIVAEKH